MGSHHTSRLKCKEKRISPQKSKGQIRCHQIRSILFNFSNVIDVSAIDSQTMEQHEYMDRARQYRFDI